MGILKDTGVTALVTRLKNWFALKAEAVFSVNETLPVNGDVHIEKVNYSENLWTDKNQQIDESFLRRTTAGSGSVSDGNAWALRIFGNMVHNGFTPESLTLSVIPIPRTAPAAITAVLDTATYLSEVTEAGTTTFTYTTEWSLNPATYGITVSNTPISGDVITVVWDGENDPVMTVTAETRTAPDPITATIDRDTFVAYVSQSGTIDLYYTTAWSADPALYGVTVTGDPVSGDQIEIVYVKEVRGTIVTANPTRLVATGWNLYEPLEGYARVINYSEAYGYKIGGTYTALAWSATLSGEQTTITPDENGLFRVPGTGYLFVTGGNDTDTYVMTTWSDMTAGYSSKYEYSLYTESAVSLTTIMTNFPKGLCKLGDVYDEIDFGHSQVISRIGWLAYSAENLATVIAGGTPYEYDETGIYYVKAQATTTAISQSNAYTVCEYGMEFFDGSDLPLYTEILYGQNLKDKLTRLNATAIPRTDSNSQTVEAKLASLDADSTSHSAALTKLDSNTNQTNDVLASAVSATATTLFNGSGGSYTGTLPNANYKFATFMVNVRGSDKMVIAHCLTTNRVAINTYNDGAWTGWKELALESDVSELKTYTGTDGTLIYRIGRTAQLAALPTVSTTSTSAVVSTISDTHFRPSSRVWFATKVYNGSNYVDCYIELATDGKISIKSPMGGVVAGYQANYTQCLGKQFMCNG